MYYVIALGNPGEEYEKTRHNTGRLVLGDFLKTHAVALAPDKKLNALRGAGHIGKEHFEVVLPETFMNASGRSVAPLVRSKKTVEKLIIVHDDVDLPLGTLKMSYGRGAAGHKGVESVIRVLKTKDFLRLRVGISPKKTRGGAKKPGAEKMNDFIVGSLKPAELEVLKKLAKCVTVILEAILTHGREKAMSLRY